MTSKECRIMRREIDELELGEQPSERATAHLTTCVSCREFHAERNELRALVSGLEPVVAPADFDMRLRARIAAERLQTEGQPFFAHLFSMPALAAATLFVVVGGSIVWVAQSNREPSAPNATQKQAPTAPSTNVRVRRDEETAAVPSVTDEETGSKPIVNLAAANAASRKNRPPRSPRSQDFSMMPAKSIRQSDQAFVNAPSKPVVFALEDQRGATRKISLPPVSFGAQSLVDNRVPVSYTGNSRVW